jgi:hypothetical protein
MNVATQNAASSRASAKVSHQRGRCSARAETSTQATTAATRPARSISSERRDRQQDRERRTPAAGLDGLTLQSDAAQHEDRAEDEQAVAERLREIAGAHLRRGSDLVFAAEPERAEADEKEHDARAKILRALDPQHQTSFRRLGFRLRARGASDGARVARTWAPAFIIAA